MNFLQLKQTASALVHPRMLSPESSAGLVAAAILTDRGDVFTGVNIDTGCGMGFCAEHAAVAAMVTAGQSKIKRIVAVGAQGSVLPPCGRCRELMRQIHYENLDALVLLPGDREVTLRELLPYAYQIDLNPGAADPLR